MPLNLRGISLHKSAQICTIFLNDFLPFRPAWRLDPSRIRACTKNAFFLRAGDGGTARVSGGKQHSLNDVAETQQNGHISHAEHEKGVRAFDLMG